MVKRVFGKTVTRMFLSNKGRFFANFATVFFSVAIATGLAALPNTYADAYAEPFISSPCPDLLVKSKRTSGFLDSELELAKNFANVVDSQSFFQADIAETDGTYNRYCILDFATAHIARPVAEQGILPSEKGQVAVAKANRNRRSHLVGETITVTAGGTLFPKELTVTSVASSIMYKSVSKERVELEDPNDERYLDRVFFLDRSSMPKVLSGMTNNLYLTLNVEHALFTQSYMDNVNRIKDALTAALGEENATILTLEENTSYATFKKYNEKVRLISYVFPLFFLAICALINHITITRLIKDDRGKLACYSSLGISKKKVVFKYALFIVSSIVLGGALGYVFGAPSLPLLVGNAYGALFDFGSVGAALQWFVPIGLATIGFLALLGISMAVFSATMYLREEPSDLMREKAPAPGKKILLERVGFFWKRLSFSMKSSLRNIFRQKKNLILTSLSIGGSELLLMLGFSLLDVSDALKSDELFGDVASSMGLISTVIALLAVGITIPILYSLANMNIEDRKRELATLKVLGYHNIECSNYTFREIIIISIFAASIGLPVSAFITDVVLRFIGFGSIADVRWWSYLASFGIIMGTTVAVNYILFPRIKKVDPNISLKALE